ncbi:hypothetical protein SELMODRAFT_133264 [Selaginella moellendorffii]|uniref:Uncharacterized protein EID1-2 n=1 Tax=Selaginella moellendorffii TaxID=88036 RepID=D8T6S5_SELML|nr:phytochrome A-associated F-box protein [Selaginella moellendorffii]EFJ07619.1 hypothetical protein SELMODRAFT_133264 [Selaginella moellendorffii]|eukprot:XP_002991321.1 phytochrome A-associated F-box protein [Selaginella moellendorffii]
MAAASGSGDGGGGAAVLLSRLSEDLLVNIFSRMEEDPRHLAVLACVCRRFGYVIRSFCWRNQCMRALPTIVPEVLEHGQARQDHQDQLGEPAGGWATLFRILVCCPGLDSAGVLLDSWDFGLERELAGGDDDHTRNGDEHRSKKRIKLVGAGPHVASGSPTFSRELGNKLLASRFRTDSLYLCDWPGCVHSEERRKYKLFRGIFKDFKASQVCRNLRDLKAKKTGESCAFCLAPSMWDMVTSFCLRRSLEYHDDGEPVVRAYVCENGHVCGAWTDQPASYVL